MDTSDFGLFSGFFFLVAVLLAACLEGSLPLGFCPDCAMLRPVLRQTLPMTKAQNQVPNRMADLLNSPKSPKSPDGTGAGRWPNCAARMGRVAPRPPLAQKSKRGGLEFRRGRHRDQAE